ncbi:MAG: MASE3 domain-containing protein, partial [Elusimicrobiota bacterium]
MKKQKILKSLPKVFLAALILPGLYIMAEVNYLLFHSLVEIFSVGVALTLFIIVYNSRLDREGTGYLILLGVAYLFVGLTDLMHTLAYSGMGIMEEGGGDLATQLWIGGRYLEVFSLMGAFIVYKKKVICKNVNYLLAFYSFIFTLLMLSIFWWDIFPVCFVEGSGLTDFKIMSEYFIVGLLLILIALVYKNRDDFIKGNDKLILKIVVFTVLSEMAFTFYVGVYDISNFAGHIFKLLSFYYVYKFVVKNLIKEPQDLLYSELKRSRERYRDIVEDMPALMCRFKPDGTLTFVNEAYADYFNTDREKLTGSNFLEFLPEEEKKEAKERLKTLTEEEPVTTYEHKVKKTKSSKSHRWQRWTDRALFDEEGKVTEYQSIGRDITESKEAEKKLKRSEKKFRSIFENSPIGKEIYDSSGRLIQVNKACLDIFGASDFSEIENFKLFEDPNLPKEAKAELKQGEPVRYQTEFDFKKVKEHDLYETSREGQIYVDVQVTPIAIEEKIDRYLVHVTDITNIKEAQKKIEEKEKKFRQLFNNVNDAIYLHKLTAEGMPGSFIEVNDTAVDMLGYKKEEFLKMSPRQIDAGEKSGKLPEIMEDMLKKGSKKFEMKHRTKSGNIIPVEIHSYILKLEGKKRVLSVARDISDRVEKERKLKELNEYLKKIFDNANMWINVLDKEEKVVIWNRAAEEISGYSEEEVKGNDKIWELLYPEKAYREKV